MIVPVVMAGGTGSRLWPVSRESRPKQFVSFQKEKTTLFQQTLLRLSGLDDLAHPVVVCNEAHRFLVAEQLREIGITDAVIVLEPTVRNTAPAVALAALCAQDQSPDACLLVLAADHRIEGKAAFHAAVEEGRHQTGGGALVTFGLKPASAHTGYGYIRRGEASGEAYKVAEFVEKPDVQTATAYVASGDYYWNSGMFMFKAADYLAELEKYEPDVLNNCRDAWTGCPADPDFRRIPEAVFARCSAISIDYAVMERTGRAVVVPLDADWSDLGAWDAIWDSNEKDADGNVCLGDVRAIDTTNSYIRSESRLVAVVGVDDAVVVDTGDALLVTNRSHAQSVKDVVQRLQQDGRGEVELHKTVRRPWGSYESIVEDEGYQVKRIIVNPGESLSLQLHHRRAEHWTVVQGTATVTCGERVFTLKPDESTYIPVQTKHRMENTGAEPVVFIEVQCGDYLGEDDIVRFEDKYGRSK